MSRRTSIVKALAEKFKLIDGTGIYKTNLFNNAYPILKFWDEINQWPAVYMSPGSESREYLPGDFTWGYLGISIKAYCKGEDSQQLLETLLEDLETCIDQNRVLKYDLQNGYETTEILIFSITTDEGLLAPYAVGEINLQVRYQVP
jgi:hypothetical protein